MTTILITGTSSGVGKVLASTLLSQGYHVVGLSRTSAQLNHPHFKEYHVDLSQPELVEQLFKTVLKDMSIDGFIHAAGVGQFGYLEQLNSDRFSQIMQVNCLSAMLITKAIVPSMKANRCGFCIYIGSEAGLQGAKQSCIYSASKFALRGFVQSLQEEVRASHINVTLINPGLLRTNFHHTCHFKPADNEDSVIDLELLAKQIVLLINNRDMGFISEINIKPYKNIIQTVKKD